jgi:hypothetical protein
MKINLKICIQHVLLLVLIEPQLIFFFECTIIDELYTDPIYTDKQFINVKLSDKACYEFDQVHKIIENDEDLIKKLGFMDKCECYMDNIRICDNCECSEMGKGEFNHFFKLNEKLGIDQILKVPLKRAYNQEGPLEKFNGNVKDLGVGKTCFLKTKFSFYFKKTEENSFSYGLYLRDISFEE